MTSVAKELRDRVSRAEEVFKKEFIGAYMALNSATLAMFKKPLYHLLLTNPQSVMKLLREYTMDDEVAVTLLLKSMLKGLVSRPEDLDEAVKALKNDDYERFKEIIKRH